MRTTFVAGCVGAAIVLAGCSSPSPIAEAAEACGLEPSRDETSISFNRVGAEESPDDTIDDVACVLFHLDTPDWVVSRIDSTRALDGTVDAAWTVDGTSFAAFWTFHPDSGLNLTVREET